MAQLKCGSWPPLQASLPKMSEKMRKIFKSQIFALPVRRHHQGEYICQVSRTSDLMERNFKRNSIFYVFVHSAHVSNVDIKTTTKISDHVYSNVYVLKDFFLCNGLETFHEVVRRVELVPRDFFSIGNAHTGAERSFSKSAVTDPPPSGVKP